MRMSVGRKHCGFLAGYDMSTLLSRPLDGMDMWRTLSTDDKHSPRVEFLYNIDREISCAAIRVNEMKLIMGQNYGDQYNGWLPLLKARQTSQAPSEPDLGRSGGP